MISTAAHDALEEVLGERVRFDHPLSRCTSLRVGGPVDAYATPATRLEAVKTLGVCSTHGIAHYMVGAGFNLLAPDEGLEGLVMQLGKMRSIERQPEGGVRADAGVSHAQITKFCSEHGLSGLEFACGIPGTVGGWIAMNAGIPNYEMKDVVREIEVLDPKDGQIRHIPRAELDFVYRSLRGLADGAVILSAVFEVSISDPESVRAEVGEYLAKRSGAQPLNVPSCGSVFKNPPGDFAGRLIEAAGLKGRQRGGAQISPMHANFIANTGGATAADILGLIEDARAEVLRTSGTNLVPEVRTLGGEK
jgi:UDP-N-acetylmuramate dehydrogenase